MLFWTSFICILVISANLARAACPHELPGLIKWSDTAQAFGGLAPIDGESLEITTPILLDVETPRLRSVVIKDGGRLVFDPTASLAKITADRITVDAEGYFDIGSFDCPFTGQAEVLLTGNKLDEDMDEDFGNKFLGVKANGSVEIHGKKKKSWTQLTKTLTPQKKIYDSLQSAQPRAYGFVFYGFDRDTGKLLAMVDNVRNTRHLQGALAKIDSSNFVVMLNRGGPKNWDLPIFGDQRDQCIDMLEAHFNVQGIELRNNWFYEDEAHVAMFDKTASTVVEKHDLLADEFDTLSEVELTQTVGGVVFMAKTRIDTKSWSNRLAEVSTIPAEGFDEYTLEVADDVSSWEAGDRIVIASTDFDMNQAEEAVVVEVSGQSVKVKGVINFVHFGEIFETIDMRAEVGLLTRNVWIHGEMEESCIPDDVNDCAEFTFDNYGGHTKAIKDFKAYNIENAEFSQMGQMEVLGSYPIHFHMCLDADAVHNPIVQSNSIHHCFSRCVTIHGTHGVHVKDNVAHDTYGHCFFLEDGGEKRNVFDGNLGLTTRKGFLTPSDSKPTTFWFTSPLVTATNNVAAGSEKNGGFGFWFIIAVQPWGPSFGLGLFKPREAKHTAITKFDNNRAHSNGNTGFAVFRRLSSDHGITGCAQYTPLEVPTDRRSPFAAVALTRYTGYKNMFRNALVRITTVEMSGFKLAESQINLLLVRPMTGGYTRVSDSIIIGETPNLGLAGRMRVKVDGRWRAVETDRSVPNPRNGNIETTGVKIQTGGPLHLEGVAFKHFKDNQYRQACALQFGDSFNHQMGPTSSVKGLTFDYNDGEGANYVCHKNKSDGGATEASMMLRDLDGSLTGQAGLRVATIDPFFTEGWDCELKANWNMSICKNDMATVNLETSINDDGMTSVMKLGGDPLNQRVGKKFYPVSHGIPLLMNWNVAIPNVFTARATGMEKGFSFRFAICLPVGVKDLAVSDFLMRKSKGDKVAIEEADSLAALESDPTKHVFLDKEKGIIHLQYAEAEEHGLGSCVGSLRLTNCPQMTFDFRKVLDRLDMTDGDCTGRL